MDILNYQEYPQLSGKPSPKRKKEKKRMLNLYLIVLDVVYSLALGAGRSKWKDVAIFVKPKLS